ncbi:T9SS type A sorting domain-containing protein [Lentimicrobium sp. S6]|uniref:T9SS type A sorting domain-containing protein n=1 Tax=Lentimicrobium sp. S6 TaxID=2735872 RepID=UPI00155657A3|nr:T9SS type A sorting domain-containing protein [Lentimicrobium sp. S6]NPD47752.1 T9SS type A sorting domain-containing protein [Lentimicrobium sp. S6]
MKPLFTTILLLISLTLFSSIIYVDIDATESNDGSSWTNAYTDLQSALSAASSTDEIWVAEGIYKPTLTTTRTISFEIPSGVEVYGGFAGTESAVSERTDFGLGGANETILSGDIGTGGDNTDNSYHVVKFTNASSETILDGFTITKGYADGGTTDIESACGGGIYNDGSGNGNSSNPKITNCIITYNYAYYQGGGVLNLANYHDTPTPPSPSTAGASSPAFTNCTITNNTTDGYGAGVNNEGEFGGVASPTFTDCDISNNTAAVDGGGIYNDGQDGTASPTFTDCTISNNTANYGGGVCNDATESSGTAVSSPTFTGSTISGNEGSYGGGICNYGNGGTSSPTFSNCNINANTASDYGAGVYNYGEGAGTASPTFTNCTFNGNSCDYDGGAMHNHGYSSGEASPTIDDCTFINNSAGLYELGGGAIQNYGQNGIVNPEIKNTIFQGNSTTGYGGAIANFATSTNGSIESEITNCLFYDNTAAYEGGAIYDWGSSNTELQIINCTFNNNEDMAYVAYGSSATVTISNSIFWDNPDGQISAQSSATINVTYSNIEGGYTGVGNINSNPLFADVNSDDYRITSLSPCADVGNDAVNSETYDIRGTGYGRKLLKTDASSSGIIDMGAYEFKYGEDPFTTLEWDAGASTAAWNTPENWSNDIKPTEYSNVIIPNLPIDPIIASNGTADCHNIIIESGAALTIEDGGSLITTGTITNNGIFTAQRTISNGQWHLISSPVAGAQSGMFKFDYLQNWNETSADWIDITELDAPLTPGKGFGFWSEDGETTHTFTGTPNNGTITHSVSFTEYSSDPDTFEGANLIGNPYPSSIDWIGLDNDWGAVYIWNPDFNNGDGTYGKYISWNNGSSSNGCTQFIPPMQAFFVVVDAGDDGTDISLTNANRTHSGASTYYKSEQDIKNGIILEAITNGSSDELCIKFHANANQLYEKRFDAYKFFNNSVGSCQLFSITGEKYLSIDVRPESEIIQLGLRNQKSGNYKIGIKEMDGFSLVELEDTKLNLFYDLSKGAYSFDWNTNDSEERFILHLKATATNELVEQEAQVYAHNGQVYIRQTSSNEFNSVVIYDLAGRVVYSSSLSQQELQSISLSNAKEAYLVQLVSDNETIVQKVVLK